MSDSSGGVVDPDPSADLPDRFPVECSRKVIVGARQAGNGGCVMIAHEVVGPFLTVAKMVPVGELVPMETLMTANVVPFKDGEW